MIDLQSLFDETYALYQEHGVKFTMDELSARLCVSKKTLYEAVRSKEELIERALTNYFDVVEREQATIREDGSLTALEKIERLLCVVPRMPFRDYRVRELRRAFPQAYLHLTAWLETGWDKTFAVMDEAIREGALIEFDKALFAKIYAYVIEGMVLEREQRSAADFAQEQLRVARMLLCGVCSEKGRAKIAAEQE